MSPVTALSWFARHEIRLAWREWLAMMTAGRRGRKRAAIIGLIILDEPLTGLDAVSARHVKGLLQDRVRAGCTVIMTTHILEVAERMADRIGVIASGRLVAEGTLAELRQQNGQNDTSLEDMFIALVDVEAAAA